MAKIPFAVPADLAQLLDVCPKFTVVTTVEELVKSTTPADPSAWHEVSYDIPGKGMVTEAKVCAVKNGIAVNYVDSYMRRRDPDCMFIGDELPTDKPRYRDVWGKEFSPVRKETFDWLAKQELVIFAFMSGGKYGNIDSIAVAPANAGFFGLGLALLQGMYDPAEFGTFKAKSILYVAPSFRHTHFDGKQVVVHCRSSEMHEIFSYNLYPGPSAKKGVYGTLLHYGEQEDWITAHCSAVQVVTPYDNKITIMHEGASGSGKSELLEHVHREADGTLVVGKNITNGLRREITLPRGCVLKPVCDDMALCTHEIQKDNGKLTLVDAENAWFIRVNHITNYGTDPDIEALSIHPTRPLLFLNIDAQPGGTALLWDHTEDAPGKPCPNPRFVLPREIVPNIVKKPVSIDIRSFGVRTPPCTEDAPSFGILGLFHILPPALGWLWRLVSPRGYANPSVVAKSDDMGSEGVGSYWPFATGRFIPHANLLLKQIKDTPKVQYVLCPNQHVGAWKIGFMSQWMMREFVARRGGLFFHTEAIGPARCSLLGYAPRRVVIEGQVFEDWWFNVDRQAEVGEEAYDAGAKLLLEFFAKTLKPFMTDELDPLGRKIIDCALNGGTLADFNKFIAGTPVVVED
jgi:hypothetical protein